MSLSNTTLSAIQTAGASVFTADADLKNAVKEYAKRVNAAMLSNPYHLGNDTLIENWKVVARLSQTLAGIEEELKKVYEVAAELIDDDQPSVSDMPTLTAPKRSSAESVDRKEDMTPTDVVAKSNRKTAKAKVVKVAKVAKVVKVAKAIKAAKTPGVKVSPAKRQPLGGNSTKLLAYFERVLNANEFTTVNQSAIGHEIGIPMGSMTLAIKKLLSTGQVIGGPKIGFKLVK